MKILGQLTLQFITGVNLGECFAYRVRESDIRRRTAVTRTRRAFGMIGELDSGCDETSSERGRGRHTGLGPLVSEYVI